jgi:MFS family permease
MIMTGHIALALLPGIPGLIAGLVLVGIGSGGLKANATALVGSLYGEKDERRDAGFSIFYMGINIGGLIGPLVTGWLQDELRLPLSALAQQPWAWQSAWSSTHWAARGSPRKRTAFTTRSRRRTAPSTASFRGHPDCDWRPARHGASSTPTTWPVSMAYAAIGAR